MNGQPMKKLIPRRVHKKMCIYCRYNSQSQDSDYCSEACAKSDFFLNFE